MANGLIQLRVDDRLKQDAADIYAQLGLDLPTAIRMFLIRSVKMRGIPFSVQLMPEEYQAQAALNAMKRLSADAEARGVSEISLDGINEEISAVRSNR